MFYDLAEGNMKRANRFKVHTSVPDFFNPEQWNALVSASPAADKFVPLLMTLILAESLQWGMSGTLNTRHSRFQIRLWLRIRNANDTMVMVTCCALLSLLCHDLSAAHFPLSSHAQNLPFLWTSTKWASWPPRRPYGVSWLENICSPSIKRIWCCWN